MNRICFSLFFLISIAGNCQDWSDIGKKINYSKVYKSAERFRDIKKALKNPTEVYSIEILVDKDGSNYREFLYNSNKFKNLHKLIIDNRWEPIDEKLILDFSIFKQLESLQIWNFKSTALIGIDKLDSLKYLILSGCHLTSFPAEVLKLKRLEYLDFTLNNLSTLPEDIGKLSILKELDLTNNCFTEIPKQLSNLKQLKYLDMNNAEGNGALYDGTQFCKNSVSSFPNFTKEIPSLIKISLYKVTVPQEVKNQLKKDNPKIKFGF